MDFERALLSPAAGGLNYTRRAQGYVLNDDFKIF
jgi:hypothetical protein